MANLNLLIQDRGKSFQIKTGEKIELKLPENPSTGYQWVSLSHPDPWLKLISEDFVSDLSTGFGAEGFKTIQYQALKPGAIVLSLVYIRPWNKEESTAEHYSVTINIQ